MAWFRKRQLGPSPEALEIRDLVDCRYEAAKAQLEEARTVAERLGETNRRNGFLNLILYAAHSGPDSK
jgi:hypothetical protein